MANRHFAKIADVWKHLMLAEVLSQEMPARYVETHAGSASYLLTQTTDRDYGVVYFREHARRQAPLEHSAYLRLVQSPTEYPGSAKQAMMLLEDRATYLVCDTDPESTATLRTAIEELNLSARARVVEGDGRAAVWRETKHLEHLVGWAVHIDPFDHFTPGGDDAPSAIDLAWCLAAKNAAVVYWYGFEDPAREDWAWQRIGSGWCGVVRFAEPDSDSGIIGCGVVVVNVGPRTIERCTRLGRALEEIYRNAPLPSGGSGSIQFVSK